MLVTDFRLHGTAESYHGRYFQVELLVLEGSLVSHIYIYIFLSEKKSGAKRLVERRRREEWMPMHDSNTGMCRRLSLAPNLAAWSHGRVQDGWIGSAWDIMQIWDGMEGSGVQASHPLASILATSLASQSNSLLRTRFSSTSIPQGICTGREVLGKALSGS